VAVAVAILTTTAATALANPGDTIWIKQFNGPGNDVARATAVSPGGSTVFVTGESDSSTSGADYATFAYSASTGTEIWAKRYDGMAHLNDRASAIGVSPDGTRVYVTGDSEIQLPGHLRSATVAYNASTGAQIWARRFGVGTYQTRAFALAVGPQGDRVYVTGPVTDQSNGPSDYQTVAYDASTGTELWAKRYNGPARSDDIPRAVGVNPNESEVYATGQSIGRGGAGYDYATVAYDASTGHRDWTTRYHGPSDDEASSLGVSPDGSMVYVTGFTFTATAADYKTIAYDASSGQEIWTRRYNGPGNGDDFALALSVAPDGSKVFVTGRSLGIESGADFSTRAYDAVTGQKIWARRYNGPGNSLDMGLALGPSPGGDTIYVTGSSVGSSSGEDYATKAYAASTGHDIWTRRYNGPGNLADRALALAVNPDGGAVYVTGFISQSTKPRLDYATIAYSA
jgi:outer membrane protein assembly factor BamB